MKKYFLLLLLVSCSGYKPVDRSNPFSEYEINSVSVPMFYNHSNLPEVSQLFTAEFVKLLNSFNRLKVIPGDSKKADAHLIGIISSGRSRFGSTAPSPIGAKGRSRSKISPREDFTVGGRNTIRFELRLVLLKNPTEKDIEFLQSAIGSQVFEGSKIVFTQDFFLSGRADNYISDGESSATNSTYSQGLRRKGIESMAKDAVAQFTDIILYVF